MTTSTRCLFYVGDVLLRQDSENKISGQVIKLSAAYDPNPESENNKFWKATPTGSMELTINNPEVFNFFTVGKKYFLTFEPAD